MKIRSGLDVLMVLGLVTFFVGACAKSVGPTDVLSQYLQLDSDAAGLSQETWPELGQLMTSTTPPSWDTFMIISRYEVGKVQSGSTRAEVEVTYYPVGKMGTSFVPMTDPEKVSYHLNKVDNQWKVDSPILIPHVSWTVMQKRLQDASAKDPKTKAANDALLQQISASIH